MSRYQVKLQDGRLIFSPTDDDECITKAARFQVGARVSCHVGKGQWATGDVVSHFYEELNGTVHPYQIKLHNGLLIYASKDDDACIQRATRVEVDQGGKESNPTVKKMQPVQNEPLADGTVQTSESTTTVRKSRRNVVMPSWATPAMTAKSAKLPGCGCGCDSEHSVLMKNILVSWQLVCVRRRCPDSPNVSISLLPSMSEAETQDIIDLTDDSESTHDAKLSASELLRALNESAYCAWRPAEPRNKLVPTARAK